MNRDERKSEAGFAHAVQIEREGSEGGRHTGLAFCGASTGQETITRTCKRCNPVPARANSAGSRYEFRLATIIKISNVSMLHGWHGCCSILVRINHLTGGTGT